MKLKFVCAVLTVCLFAGAMFIDGNSQTHDTHENKTYTVLASCFPVYALTEAVIGDVPGLSVQMLTLPRQEGYSEYELSDWENAYAGSADIFVCLGNGFESFDRSILNEDCIIITLLADEELLKTEPLISSNHPQDATFPYINYIYLSVDGSRKLLSKLSEAFISVDPQYEEIYEVNTKRAAERIERIEYRAIPFSHKIAIEPAFAYMINEAGISAESVLFADEEMTLPDDTVDMRGKLNAMLDMDSSFTFENYVNAFLENYSLLYEAVK